MNPTCQVCHSEVPEYTSHCAECGSIYSTEEVLDILRESSESWLQSDSCSLTSSEREKFARMFKEYLDSSLDWAHLFLPKPAAEPPVDVEFEESYWVRLVREFHEKFDLPLRCPDNPGFERAAQRISHLQEEVNELSDALESLDFTEAVDGLVDIIYLAIGGLIQWGVNADSVFSEVHRSNMTKRSGPPENKPHGLVHKGPEYEPPDIDLKIALSSGPRVPLRVIQKIIALCQSFGLTYSAISESLGVDESLVRVADELSGRVPLRTRTQERELPRTLDRQILAQAVVQAGMRVSAEDGLREDVSESKNLQQLQSAVELLAELLAPTYPTPIATKGSGYVPADGRSTGTVRPAGTHPLDPWVGRRITLDIGQVTVVRTDRGRVTLRTGDGQLLDRVWRRSWVGAPDQIGFFAGITLALCEHDYQSRDTPDGDTVYTCDRCNHSTSRRPTVVLFKEDRITDMRLLLNTYGPGWYFRTPFSEYQGPFATRAQAFFAMRQYVKTL